MASKAPDFRSAPAPSGDYCQRIPPPCPGSGAQAALLSPPPAAAAPRPQRTRLSGVLSNARVAVGFRIHAPTLALGAGCRVAGAAFGPPHQSLTGQLGLLRPEGGRDGTELEPRNNSIPRGRRETLAREAPALPQCARPSLPPAPQLPHPLLPRRGRLLLRPHRAMPSHRSSAAVSRSATAAAAARAAESR